MKFMMFILLAVGLLLEAGETSRGVLIPLVLESEASQYLAQQKLGDGATLTVTYQVEPGAEALFLEPGERIWWLGEHAVLFLGSGGYALPPSITNRATVTVTLSRDGVDIPGGTTTIRPLKGAVLLSNHADDLAKSLAEALGNVDATYLAQVANYIAGNSLLLDVEATSYAVSGVGTVIDSAGNWTGNAIASETPQQLLDKLVTVDGAGSSLDADSLDGLDSASLVQTSGAQSISGSKAFVQQVTLNGLQSSGDVILGAVGDGARLTIFNNGDGVVLRDTTGVAYGELGLGTDDDFMINMPRSGGKIRMADDLMMRYTNSSTWRDLFLGKLEVNDAIEFYLNDVKTARIQATNTGVEIRQSSLKVDGDLLVTGVKNFVQPHPTDVDKQIFYVSLEGGEAGTYCRGQAHLVDGVATIQLPEHFRMVTNGEMGLTAQVTAQEDCAGIYVTKVTNQLLEVRELGAGNSNASFAYTVNGLRAGYENHQVIRPVPSED